MLKIAIVGAGGFATAIAKLLSYYKKYEIVVWSLVKEEIENIKKDGENLKYLPGIKLNLNEINFTIDENIFKKADLIIFAVASKFLREVAKKICKHFKKNAIILNLSKGLEQNTFKRLSEVLFEETNSKKIVVLSGPSHAEEVAKFLPTTVVVSCKNNDLAKNVQKILNSDVFRVYVNNDIVGVEIGAALKNIIAIAVGICDGLNLGDNSKAALITRGLVEIRRFGVFMGANSKTFFGLSGLGDLVVTCTSTHSRNNKFGCLIGKGEKIKNALKKINMTVEGYFATKAVYEFSKIKKIDMPITEQLYKILYEDFDVKDAIKNLMQRNIKNEYNDFF